MRPLGLVIILLAVASCEPPPDSDTLPDEVLQAELGLTSSDRVHKVTLTGGEVEQADPVVISIEPGSHVEFITTDWLIHEVLFDEDSLAGDRWEFLAQNDQTASPPLLEKETRYLLSFVGAPPGRYPYRIEGNGDPGRGVIIVTSPQPR